MVFPLLLPLTSALLPSSVVSLLFPPGATAVRHPACLLMIAAGTGLDVCKSSGSVRFLDRNLFSAYTVIRRGAMARPPVGGWQQQLSLSIWRVFVPPRGVANGQINRVPIRSSPSSSSPFISVPMFVFHHGQLPVFSPLGHILSPGTSFASGILVTVSHLF